MNVPHINMQRGLFADFNGKHFVAGVERSKAKNSLRDCCCIAMKIHLRNKIGLGSRNLPMKIITLDDKTFLVKNEYIFLSK